MTNYSIHNSRVQLAGNLSTIKNHIPSNTYVVKSDPMAGWYLEETNPFTLPKKIYGDVKKMSERILNTYHDRPDKNTGVLLVGQKGSGKTLLMKKICIDSNLPVIIINEPYIGDSFFSFISGITDKCIVVLDEFEKIYKDDRQEQMLTLLDGSYQSNKLFILTCNEKRRINDYLINRPGRIFYKKEFHGIDDTFIKEFSEDNLKDPEKALEVLDLSKEYNSFNFDILSSLIEEMNRYEESPRTAIKMLNVERESTVRAYKYRVFYNDEELKVSAASWELFVYTNPFDENRDDIIKLPIYMKNEFKKETYEQFKLVEREMDYNGNYDLGVLEKLRKEGKVHFGIPEIKLEEENSSIDGGLPIEGTEMKLRRLYSSESLDFFLDPEYIVETNKTKIVYDFENGIKIVLTV